MALVLIATPGASNANTYITRDKATVILESVLNNEPWINASSAQKDIALVEATRDIDSLPLRGVRYYNYPEGHPSRQALHFPTSTHIYMGKLYIPAEVEIATVFQALYLLRSGTEQQARKDMISAGVISHSMGNFSETLSQGTGYSISTDARRYLWSWIDRSIRLDRG